MVTKTVNCRQADTQCQHVNAISVAEEQRVADNVKCLRATLEAINNSCEVLDLLELALSVWAGWGRNSAGSTSPSSFRDVDVDAGVDQHVLGLRHHVFRQRAGIGGRIGRDEPAALHRLDRVLDVVYAQTRVEIGEIDQVARLLDVGQ